MLQSGLGSMQGSSSTKSRLPLKGVFHHRSSSTKGRLPPKVVFNQRLSSTKVVFHWRLSSTKGRLPTKVVFHQRSSSTKGHLPPKVVFHQPWHLGWSYICENSQQIRPQDVNKLIQSLGKKFILLLGHPRKLYIICRYCIWTNRLQLVAIRGMSPEFAPLNVLPPTLQKRTYHSMLKLGLTEILWMWINLLIQSKIISCWTLPNP